MPFKFALKTEEKRPAEATPSTSQEPAAKKRRATPNASSLVIMEKLASPQRPARLPISADLLMCIYKAASAHDSTKCFLRGGGAGDRQSGRRLGFCKSWRQALSSATRPPGSAIDSVQFTSAWRCRHDDTQRRMQLVISAIALSGGSAVQVKHSTTSWRTTAPNLRTKVCRLTWTACRRKRESGW